MSAFSDDNAIKNLKVEQKHLMLKATMVKNRIARRYI